jgi:hypothetical protein
MTIQRIETGARMSKSGILLSGKLHQELTKGHQPGSLGTLF